MGNVERCDKTLPLNERMFYVRKDARLRARWQTDLEGLCREFGLGREESEALAFTHGPADAVAYMPAIAWRTGTGMVVWNELA